MNEEQFRRSLRGHHAGVEPDSGFASRVAARLEREPSQVLGRAALRLLPATAVLALVLAWLSLRQVAPPTAVFAPTENVLTWLVDRASEQ